MKKVYIKPKLEIEQFELRENIAQNCGTEITLGPGDYEDYVCKEFEDSFVVMSVATYRASDTPFYDGNVGPTCDCYYSSGGQNYFSS